MAHSKNSAPQRAHVVSEQEKSVTPKNASKQGKGTPSEHAPEHAPAPAHAPEQAQSASRTQLNESDTLLRSPLNHVDIPEQLRESMTLFLRLIRRVISEYDHTLRNVFDTLLADFVEADNYARLHDAKPWETQASAANLSLIHISEPTRPY